MNVVRYQHDRLVALECGERVSADKNVAGSNQRRMMSALATYIRLAAFPIFAGLALVTALRAGGMPNILCSVEPPPFHLSGMGTMYALMSIFHAPPWLALIARCAPNARR